MREEKTTMENNTSNGTLAGTSAGDISLAEWLLREADGNFVLLATWKRAPAA